MERITCELLLIVSVIIHTINDYDINTKEASLSGYIIFNISLMLNYFAVSGISFAINKQCMIQIRESRVNKS
jgi:hypothetical protein